MHKSLALLALIVLNSCLAAGSDPDRPVTCKITSNPTPDQVLRCRKMFQDMDSDYENCCLQRRKSYISDNCLPCAAGKSVEVAYANEDKWKITFPGGCRSDHRGQCQLRMD